MYYIELHESACRSYDIELYILKYAPACAGRKVIRVYCGLVVRRGAFNGGVDVKCLMWSSVWAQYNTWLCDVGYQHSSTTVLIQVHSCR